MNLNTINLLIIINILVLVLEYKDLRKNLNYITFFSIITLSLINYSDFVVSYMFNFPLWKTIFIFLVSLMFFIILNLIKNGNFDIYCLLILVFIGSLILILCDNLITLYLGLELQTFSIFILIAKNRLSIKGSEAGLKYFILGALSSGFYLLGLTILFLLGSSLNLSDINLILNESFNNIAITLITLSFCFKLSLFPLHFWIPDIYEGSSWDIISLISSLPKISVISVLIQLLINSNMVLTFSLLSIIIGTLGSLNQSKLKRLLGYSGISHMGFTILGFSLLSSQGFIISNLYLFIYSMTMISIFCLIIYFNFSSKFIIELGFIKFSNLLFPISLVILILSIAGIPPLSGFVSKWFLLWSVIEFNYNISSFLLILFSAIGAGYYLRLVKIIYFQKSSSYLVWTNSLKKRVMVNELNFIIIGFIIFLSLFLLLNFNFIIDLINILSISIF